MNNTVLTKSFDAPRFCEAEILRYACCKAADDSVKKLLNDCLEISKNKFKYKVCFCKLSVKICGDLCDFGVFKINSKALAKNLEGCCKVILFGATVGAEIDRLILKYGKISPSKAVVLDAIGTERIEALCDEFCSYICTTYNVGTKPRFGAGYGDLSLETQKDIFKILNPSKTIGLTVNDSLIMSPKKSVTAFLGIGKLEQSKNDKCSECTNSDCVYRGAL